MSKISSFSGDYRFLSNFWPCEVVYDGDSYSSVEHAYQAAKTNDMAQRRAIRLSSKAGDAKRLGRTVSIRSDWNRIKLHVMTDLVRQKFNKGDYLTSALLNTGGRELEEGNYWGDRFWGVCGGVGENHLGKILMQVRDELQGKI